MATDADSPHRLRSLNVCAATRRSDGSEPSKVVQ